MKNNKISSQYPSKYEELELKKQSSFALVQPLKQRVLTLVDKLQREENKEVDAATINEALSIIQKLASFPFPVLPAEEKYSFDRELYSPLDCIPSLSVFRIYIFALEQIKQNQELQDEIIHKNIFTYLSQTTYLHALVYPNSFNLKEINTAAFFMLVMKHVAFSHAVNREQEFDSFINILGENINENIRSYGNTPLIWSIANSNLVAFHKFFNSLEKSDLKNHIDLDVHCHHYFQSSALLLACAKGEIHRCDSKNFKDENSLDYMESAINTLLKYGASPLKKCGKTLHISPFQMMILRRSSNVLTLMLQKFDSRCMDDNDKRLIEKCLEIKYETMLKITKKIVSICSFPTKEDWQANYSAVKQILQEHNLLPSCQSIKNADNAIAAQETPPHESITQPSSSTPNQVSSTLNRIGQFASSPFCTTWENYQTEPGVETHDCHF